MPIQEQVRSIDTWMNGRVDVPARPDRSWIFFTGKVKVLGMVTPHHVAAANDAILWVSKHCKDFNCRLEVKASPKALEDSTAL